MPTAHGNRDVILYNIDIHEDGEREISSRYFSAIKNIHYTTLDEYIMRRRCPG
jgi:hypothetical protein